MKRANTSASVSVPAFQHTNTTRRRFLTVSGGAAAAALVATAVPAVHAAGDSTIRLAIVGCGPRGRGALVDALGSSSSTGNTCMLWAVAELFKEKATDAVKSMTEKFPGKVSVPEERQFLGFDAYRKAIDTLRPGDIAMLTTRAAFRPTHFDYAVSKGVNIFMEKAFAADPGGIARVLKTGELAEQKGLKVACGLQCRHSKARQALIQRIRDGAIGEVQLIRAYRMQPGGQMGPRKGATDNELLFQIRNSVPFLWSSSGTWLENMIHQVDECCWLKDAWPVSAHGLGGRVAGSKDCSQNLDTYSIEYTFPDGTKALVNGRFVPKCFNDFATYVHGTRCAAQFSGMTHAATVQTYNDQRIDDHNISWRPSKEAVSPWQAEWDDFLDAIRMNQPYNETRRSALANLAGLMGRAAVHCGRVVTWDEMLASRFLFCPNIDTLTEMSEPPIKPDAEGRYPAPVPGTWTEV